MKKTLELDGGYLFIRGTTYDAMVPYDVFEKWDTVEKTEAGILKAAKEHPLAVPIDSEQIRTLTERIASHNDWSNDDVWYEYEQNNKGLS